MSFQATGERLPGRSSPRARENSDANVIELHE
jgi:hypothetical protein